MWGVRDHSDKSAYGRNVLGVRQAVPRMLDLFVAHGIHATWATVGFVFCEGKDELLASLPSPPMQPRYANTRLSNYNYLGEVGENEKLDPYYFAPSLVDRIRKTPGQEIGTHSLAHTYALEPGMTIEAFEADLAAALQLAKRRGLTLRSIVFPRNQYGLEHLALCERLGITHYRGNPSTWAYRASDGAGQTLLRRAVRLVDAYSGILGDQSFALIEGTPRNVPASRFLRPCIGRLSAAHPRHIATIKREMTSAARAGRSYHLWWHPHNFGVELEANMRGLTQILQHYRQLHDQLGMLSKAMGEHA